VTFLLKKAVRCYRTAFLIICFGSFFANPMPLSAETLVERGAYLTAAGGCYGCHTNTIEGSQPFAGGRALKTPFGVFYSPNITPDTENGIGDWTDIDFLTAVRHGISPSGDPYFPVFPYTSYTKMTDEDALAIKAYLHSLPKASVKNREHEVSIPFSWRWLQWGWRLLFFDEGPYVSPAAASEPVARGGYLVEALTHCGECHTPRNMFGGTETGMFLAGTPNGGEGEVVPNITPDPKTGIGDWSEAEIVSFMKDGMMPDFDNVQGSMAEVIDHSLSKLTEDDLQAIAAYLKSIKAIENTVSSPSP
jgi:mono/diheme cytochrome c family protein